MVNVLFSTLRKFRLYFSLILMLCLTNYIQANEKLNKANSIIYAKDFGILPNGNEDYTQKITNLLTYCRENKVSRLIFSPGRYDFYPEHSNLKTYYISNTSSESEKKDKTKHIGLLIEHQKNLLIDATGVSFVFHGKMTPMAIVNSSHITVKGLMIDFERPTMSEFTIRGMSRDSMLVEVNPSSTYKIKGDSTLLWYGHHWEASSHLHAVAIDPSKQENYYADYAAIHRAQVKELAQNKLVFYGEFERQYAKGTVISVRNTIRDEVGSFVYLSDHVVLDGLKIHYMHGIGITSQFSSNLSYKNIQIKPSEGRTIAAFADGMQFSGCKGFVKIKNCHFEGLHDDAINIHGTYLQLEKINEQKEVVVTFKHHQTYGFQPFFPADEVQFVSNNTMTPVAANRVVAVEQLSLTQFKLTFEKELEKEISLGDVLENLTWTPQVEISDCYITSTNTRGILVTTAKQVVIRNNTFFKTGMHGILIAADANSWFESGAVNDVLIAKNKFIECGYNLGTFDYAIAILPEVKSFNDSYVHANIKIENNIFQLRKSNAVVARYVNGLLFSRNKIYVRDANTQKLKEVITGKESVNVEKSKSFNSSNNKYFNL